MFRKKTGLPVDAYFSATKVEWILKNVPGVLARARKGELLFGTTDSWVLWKLTGGAVHATDYTNASRTMVFNIGKLCWDEKLIKKFGIPREMLPAVRPSSGVFGQTVKIGRLPSGIPITGIAGDQQAALFGQACFAAGTMKNTYGTGAFLLLNTGRKRIPSTCGLITTVACGPRGEPFYALEGSIFIAGAAIQWLRDGIRILPSASLSQKMAEAIKTNDGVYFVPALVGLGAPYWAPNARGTITGLTRGATANHLARAALEAMCYQTKDVVMAMQKDSGIKIKNLKIDGGAAANDFLCQFQADILRMDIVRPKVIETTSRGAAYLAGLAVGYWKNAREIEHCWEKDRVFKPRISAAKAAAYYAGWQKAVRQTLD